MPWGGLAPCQKTPPPMSRTTRRSARAPPVVATPDVDPPPGVRARDSGDGALSLAEPARLGPREFGDDDGADPPAPRDGPGRGPNEAVVMSGGRGVRPCAAFAKPPRPVFFFSKSRRPQISTLFPPAPLPP